MEVRHPRPVDLEDVRRWKGRSRAYETSASRLKSKTDALGQVIAYGYAKDNNLLSITYTNARNPTPNVSFTYDPYTTALFDGGWHGPDELQLLSGQRRSGGGAAAKRCRAVAEFHDHVQLRPTRAHRGPIDQRRGESNEYGL